MTSIPYIGRFAPSPTGPMHFGTLIAAVASYLQAKVNQGKWLVRMEDVDTMRNVKGADTQLLNSLQAFGFVWDNDVLYQTTCNDGYQRALEQLDQQNLVFPCACSRKHLSTQKEYQNSGVYPGTCRENSLPFEDEHAIRLKVNDTVIKFSDEVMGLQQENLATMSGDFVIKRRDGLFAYQLAVVVDDALQGVTEVVRGADLLDSTARQIYLQRCLGYPTPAYLHLPLALGADGDKLSKLTAAEAVDDQHPVTAIVDALNHLGQQAPETLKKNSLDECWAWAIKNWNPHNIPRINRVV